MSRFAKLVCLMVCGFSLVFLTGARRKAVETKAEKAPKAAVSSGSGAMLVDTSSANGWEQFLDNGAVMKLSSVAGKTGKALEISYSMGPGGWVLLSREIQQDLTKVAGIRFTYKGEGSQNTLECKLTDGDGSNFGKFLIHKSAVPGWTTVEVPFSQLQYLWGGDTTLDLKKANLQFAVSKKADEGDEGGTGKVLVCNIETFGTGSPAAVPVAPKAAAAAMPDGVLDTMDAVAGWEKYNDNTVTIALASVTGKTSNAMAIDYNMNQGAWLGVWKQIDADLSKAKGVRFSFKGDGSPNAIEFKIEDMDGSNYGKLLSQKSNTASWTTIEVPFSELTYFWGGNQSLDLIKPKIHFAISKKGDDDQGGKGKFIVDQIELIK